MDTDGYGWVYMGVLGYRDTNTQQNKVNRVKNKQVDKKVDKQSQKQTSRT